MPLVHRILPPKPVESLEEYVTQRGGRGVEAASHEDAEAIVAQTEASGLRGRGGAGFPTGRKWRTIRENASDVLATTVVVNGAEGEPGTFKDRTILRIDPYAVIEGALIGAYVVGADEIVLGLKRSFATELPRVQAAIDQITEAGWADGVRISIFQGDDPDALRNIFIGDFLVEGLSDVPAPNDRLKVLQTRDASAFYILNLANRTAAPLQTSTSNIALSISPRGDQVWTYVPYGTTVSTTDFAVGVRGDEGTEILHGQ